MRFFKLTHPPYASDLDADVRNPVTSVSRYHVPGVHCDVCGSWASSARLRIPVPMDAAAEFSDVKFLPVAEWQITRASWARALGVNIDVLVPGATLGPPEGECSSAIHEDVVHPIPGEIWVTNRVREALSAADLTGVSFAQVRLSKECGGVNLWELVVHGRAWRKGVTAEDLLLCKVCGRRGFPSPKVLSVDEARWDGSDFVIVDKNPNIIIVSERASSVLDSGIFANIAIEPID